jgi:hypothetical protein
MIEIFILGIGLTFVALGVLAPFLFIRCATLVGAGAKWIVGIFVLETLLVTLPPLPIGINVYPQDLVFLLLGTCAIGRFFRNPKNDLWSFTWMVIGAVWLALFVIGLVKYKTVAGVEFRPFYYFWAAAAYFASFSYKEEMLPDVWRMLKWGATALLVIACYRWAADAVGFSSVNWGVLVGASPFRVLNSAHAHFLASVLMVLLIRYGAGQTTRADGYLTIALALAVLLLQHRTVWVLIFIAVAVAIYRDPATRKRIALPFLLGGIAVLLMITMGFMSGALDTVFAALQRSVEEAFKGDGSTLSWRLQSWEELLKNWAADDPHVNMFGYPFGHGWERYVADLKHSTNYSPHSFYVQLLLRGGIVAFILMFGVYLTALLKLKIFEIRSDVFSSLSLFVILFGQLVYCVTYGPGYMQGVFLGMSFSLLGEALRLSDKNSNSKRPNIAPQHLTGHSI